MKLTASIIAVAALAVVVSAFYLGDVAELNACSSSASASAANASCQVACSNAAAAVTANADACCKATIANVMAKFCYASTASASGCSKSTATTASAKSAYCAKTLGAMTADAGDCCKATVTAFVAAAYAPATKSAYAGCSKSAAAYASAGSSSSCSRSASYAAIDNDMPYRTGTRLVLTGTALCGSCNLKTTESCYPVFQTADGKIYPLMKNDYVKEMRNTKTDNGFEIVTRVRRLDGVKYLEVQNLKTL